MDAIIACNICSLVQHVGALPPGTAAHCGRCGSVVGEKKAASLAPTAALSLAALILYVPANVYPILSFTLYGAHADSTVWDGVVSLTRHDEWLVGVIVFLASMLVPLAKLLGLFFLVVTVRLRSTRWLRERTWIYRFIEAAGPWAMLDVFLLAILVALVKLRDLATVLPGPGLIAFACVVVLTTLASASFDPRLIWEGGER
jgi:paraquat-inducible protein A